MYKNYALIENGVVVSYPVNVHEISSTALPHNWPGGELNGKTYVFCHDQKPSRNWDEVEVETTPYFDQESGFWYRGYVVQPASQDVIDGLKNHAKIAAESNIAGHLTQYSEERADEFGLSESQRAAWAQYRVDVQAIVDQPGYPMQILWPTPPDSFENNMKLEVVRV